MLAAQEISLAFNKKPLQWLPVDKVTSLCARCSSLKHDTKDCDTFISREPKPPTRNVQALYDRFKVRGRTSSRSTPSQSRTGSSPRRPCSSSTSSKKSVTYADAAKGLPLESSIHASGHRQQQQQQQQQQSSSNTSSSAPKSSDKGKQSTIPPAEKQANMDSLNSSILEKLVLSVDNLTQQVASLKSSVDFCTATLAENDQRLTKLEAIFGSLPTNTQAPLVTPTAPSSVSPSEASAVMARVDRMESNNAVIINQVSRMSTIFGNLAERLGFTPDDLSSNSPQHNNQ